MRQAPTVQFICEGCGVDVVAIGWSEIPKHGFCAVCAWACEFASDPEETVRMVRECREHLSTEAGRLRALKHQR